MPLSPIEKLVELLKNDKVIPFIGSGVSTATANTLGWHALIQNGIDYARARHLDKDSLLIKVETELEKYNYLEASNYLKEVLTSPYPFNNWINDNFHKLNISSKDLINSILDLSTPTIATTNYDTLLTQIDNVSNRLSFYHSQYQQCEQAIKKGEEVVFHLHGIYTVPESVVLSKNDYNSLNQNRGYKTFLQKLFADYHFLFIGCSKDGVLDEDFSTLFNFIKEWFPNNSNQHYILLHEKEIKNHNHIELLTRCNIEAINYGNDYSLLTGFINSINPNIHRRKEKIKQHEANLRKAFERVAKLTNNFSVNSDEINNLVNNAFGSKYDWIDSEKLKNFEKVFEDYNKSILEKKQKLIATQNILKSIVDIDDLKEKVSFWESNRSSPHNFDIIDYTTTATIAYKCLERIPKDILRDIQFTFRNVIHVYYFDGNLKRHIDSVEKNRKRKINLEERYKNDEYLLENLKRIIDSLYGFLKLPPDDLYDDMEKASITKELPDSFFVVLNSDFIEVIDANNLNNVCANLPLEKSYNTYSIDVIHQNSSYYIIGFNSKYCFYWNPEKDVFLEQFYSKNSSVPISEMINYKDNLDIISILKKGKDLIRFKNFEKTSTINIFNKYSDLVNDCSRLFGLHDSDSFYNGTVLSVIDFELETETPILSTEDLFMFLKNNKNIDEFLKNNLSDYKMESYLKDEFVSVMDTFELFPLNKFEKDHFLLNTRFLTSDLHSLSFIVKIENNTVEILDVAHLDHSICFSLDHIKSEEGFLKIFYGYLDMKRDEIIGEHLIVKNYKFIEKRTIAIKRDSKKVRDVFETIYTKEGEVILNLEGENIIRINPEMDVQNVEPIISKKVLEVKSIKFINRSQETTLKN